jgi:hypothetical protein
MPTPRSSCALLAPDPSLPTTQDRGVGTQQQNQKVGVGMQQVRWRVEQEQRERTETKTHIGRWHERTLEDEYDRMRRRKESEQIGERIEKDRRVGSREVGDRECRKVS